MTELDPVAKEALHIVETAARDGRLWWESVVRNDPVPHPAPKHWHSDEVLASAAVDVLNQIAPGNVSPGARQTVRQWQQKASRGGYIPVDAVIRNLQITVEQYYQWKEAQE